MMVVLKVLDCAQVDSVHTKVIALGGLDEGVPDRTATACSMEAICDLDGNKLNAYMLVS